MALSKAGFKRVPREVLNASRTYYVRTDGSDSNTGLANTAGGAFLTIQKALNVAATLDCGTFNLTIQVAAGTYTGAITLPPLIGSGTFTLQGDVATPANVIISVTGASRGISASNSGSWTIKGFRVQTITSGVCIYVWGNTSLNLGEMDYGVCADAYHVQVTGGGRVNFIANYTISGNSTWAHIGAAYGAYVVYWSITVTASGTRAFTQAFIESTCGIVDSGGCTFVGTFTGRRFVVANNGLIRTNSGGLNYFPGNVPGTVNSSGVYDDWTGGVRELLSAARTYYVRADGSDSNNGLVNTAAGAFLTIQKAIDTVYALDNGGYNVTIQLADGTYTAANVAQGKFIGKGAVVISGNSVTPANVVLSAASGRTLYIKEGALLTVQNLEIRSTNDWAVVAEDSGTVFTIGSGVRIGSAGSALQLVAYGGGKIFSRSNYSIVGAASNHWAAMFGGVIDIQGITITITGTPAFPGGFAAASGGSIINCAVITFSGSATGPRYGVTNNAVISTNGAGVSYLPGNAVGSGTNSGVAPYGLYV